MPFFAYKAIYSIQYVFANTRRRASHTLLYIITVMSFKNVFLNSVIPFKKFVYITNLALKIFIYI